MLSRYTIGSDPEIFIFNTKTKKVVSAIDKIPGSKEEPFREGLPEGFGLQTDNILAEFNIPPVTSLESFLENIDFMKNLIRQKVQEIDPNYDVLCAASAKVPVKELKHPQAKQFFCDPDYCIYTGEENVKPSAVKTNTRSCGFHLHVGYKGCNTDTSTTMLRYIDAVVGLPSILYDTDTERRSLYGQAGCFRLCKYGFEYRTLSGYWLDNPSRLTFIWNQLTYALQLYEHGIQLPEGRLVREIINTNNVNAAKKLIEEFSFISPRNIKPE